MVMKTNEKTSSLARVALGATAVLALAGRAHAVACAVNTYYDGTTKSGEGGVFNAAADCTVCGLGTTAAAVPDGSARTYCEGIAANYYGSEGLVLSSDATATACATTFSNAIAGSVVSDAGSLSQTDCVTAPGYIITTARGGGANAASVVVTAQVAANKYSAGGASLYNSGTTSGTACPYAGTSTAGATHVSECTPDCATTTPNSNAVAFLGTCVCAANAYGAPKDTNNAALLAVTTGCTLCTATFTGIAAAHLTSAQGSTLSSHCKSAPGYYISTAAAGTAANARVTIAPQNSWVAGGADLTGATTSATACTYAGTTTGTGASAITACTPDCVTTNAGTLAVATGGTCACAAGAYGTVVGTGGGTVGAATSGCTDCRATYTGILANSYTSVVGTNTLKTHCLVKPGYIVTTDSSGGDAAARTGVATSGKYAAGLVNYAATTTATACPFAGTTATTTSSSVQQCVPDCSKTTIASLAVAQAGTCVCAAGAWGTPTSSGGAGTLVDGGCTACAATYSSAVPNGVTSAMGSTAKTDCKTASGYVISTKRTSADTDVVVTRALANKYSAGAVGLSSGAVSTGTSCPANSASAVGSGKISDCKCAAGYSAGSTTCVQCPANTYHAGGDAVGTPTNCLGCAAGFTSAAGASSCTAVVTPTAPTTTSPTAAAGADEKSGSSTTSVIAAISAVAAAQFVL